jgi:hypothetical protein
MFKSMFISWGKRKSREQIELFLTPFTMRDPAENGPIMGMVALVHAQTNKKDPEFQMILNSDRGVSSLELGMQIIHLNRLFNELHKARRTDDAIAVKFWNTTFRCMQHDEFHSLGIRLWEHAKQSFPHAEAWLREARAKVPPSGTGIGMATLDAAISLSRFVPPRFIQ